MKKIIFLLLLFKGFYSFGNRDTCSHKKFDLFKEELNFFIDTIKPNSIGRGKYLVFVANIHYSNSSKNHFCFTLGYILNSFELEYVSANYVYYFKDEIVLISTDRKINNFFIDPCFKKIEEEDSIKIRKKLFPEEDGGITAITRGYIYCQEADTISKTFYQNSDEIPLEKSIYKYFPSGGTIEQIEDK